MARHKKDKSEENKNTLQNAAVISEQTNEDIANEQQPEVTLPEVVQSEEPIPTENNTTELNNTETIEFDSPDAEEVSVIEETNADEHSPSEPINLSASPLTRAEVLACFRKIL